MKKILIPDRIVLIVLLSGMIPASRNWPWAKVTIALWLGILFLQRMKPDFLRKLHSFVLFLAMSATGWAIANRLFASLPLPVFFALWGCLFAYLLKQLGWGLRTSGFFSLPSFWPTRPMAALLTIVPVGLACLVHGLLAHRHGMALDPSLWTSVTWMVVFVLVFYPPRIEEPYAFLKAKPSFILMMHIFILLFAHHREYVAMRNEMYLSYGSIAEKAFQHGFADLGVESVILDTHLRYRADWVDAVRSFRAQCRNGSLPEFAQALNRHPVCRNLLFFRTLMFGSQLHLQPGETTVDLLARPSRKELFVLTSAGRLLRMGDGGVTTLWNLAHRPLAMAASSDGNALAVLAVPNLVVVWNTEQNLPILYLPHEGPWVDVQLSADGQSVFVLADNGLVEKYGFHATDNQWKPFEPMNDPLWKHGGGKRILLDVEEKGVLLLDAHGGLRWCGVGGGFKDYTEEDYARYYNPLAAPMADMAFWGHGGGIMLSNIHGRIHFLDPKEDRLIKPVKADMNYNARSSRWDYPDRVVAIEPIPELDMILQLSNHGIIRPILLPQRNRVKVSGKWIWASN